MSRLVTDAMIEAALEYLAQASEPAAAARAERVRSEHNRKRTRARLMYEADGPVSIREAHAECHADYEEACEREARAVQNDEWHRLQRGKAEAILEAYRTEEATRRAGKDFR